jgi:hypothetical protein
VRVAAALVLTLAVAGCASVGAARSSAAADGDALERLAQALPGDYDDHAQVQLAGQGAGIAPLHVVQTLRVVDRGREEISWLWRLQADGQSQATVWLMRARATDDARGVQIVPYRALDAASVATHFSDAEFRVEAAQWAELQPCAQTGEWKDAGFAAAANADACSALLPGLGESAALLPLRMALAGELLRVQTFADRSRGADAMQEARRVSWFSGWAAINGGGPRASAENQDWHLQRDLRLGSEGSRVALHWRDGAPSGYSLELERTTYPERKLSVLQLNVIEDASGKTMTYAWTDPQAKAIGLNLGWLQVGLTAGQ